MWIKVRSRLSIDRLDLEGEFGRLVLMQDDLQVCIVCWLLAAGASGDPYFTWVPNLQPVLLDWSTRNLPRFTKKRMQFLTGLRQQHASSKERGEWLEIVLKVWHLYSAAESGEAVLEEQTYLLFDHASPDRDFALQMTLSEAIGMEDVETVRTLLNFGVDPNTTLLPVYDVTNNDTCLDALPRAAGLHAPALVTILIKNGANLTRLRPLALHLAVLNTNGFESTSYGNMNFHQNIPCGTLHLIMRALGRLEAVHEIAPRPIPFCLDTVVPQQNNRYAIVKRLRDHAGWHLTEREKVSSLESTLLSTATPDLPMGPSSISEWRNEQKQSLRLFEEFRGLGAEIPPSPQRLLSLLLLHRCPISTFKHIVTERPSPGHLDEGYSKLVVYSIALGQPRPAEWLIEQGVNVNAGLYRNRTALWAASANKAPDSFIRLLIEKGAKLELPLKTPGRTPLQVAASKGYIAVASSLLCHGALINARCGKLSGEPLRMTALDWAATMGRLDMVRFLVDCGGQSSYKGLTNFDGAFWHARGHLGVLNFFERHTQHSFSVVMSSLRRNFSDLLISDKDIIDLTRYEDWNSETDWNADDWSAEG
ncbi:hypothetical protein PG993_000195 [Apiospora rasikravindrae]|uniref:Ankyrin n=1 Tax=Apiospora rasikravindrae TaxID=990691 RepID=A0ABR1U7W3_9PEZI